MQGIVIKSTGSWFRVMSGDKTYECRIKGKFRLKGIKTTNPVAVGDQVLFDLEEDEEIGVITKIFDRKNYIIRKSVNLSKQTQILAANIDQVFLLITIDNPPTHTGFIDRFLVSAEAYHIPTVLVFNKMDEVNKDEYLRYKQEIIKDIYEKIGYECIELSAKEQYNIDIIKNKMRNKVSTFAGHSGVGKSTLVNAIESALNLKTKEVSTSHSQGQHTTTFAAMYPLSFGGFIIDTPGIKGFGLVDMEKSELSNYFPEFFKLKEYCKFNNCLHVNEPHCAIKEAVEQETIDISRYENYVQMLEGDQNYR
jgi:ribosome biogenesis GTPase